MFSPIFFGRSNREIDHEAADFWVHHFRTIIPIDLKSAITSGLDGELPVLLLEDELDFFATNRK
jgi:hypothetical protein